MSTITRDNAIDLLKNYNKDPFHIQHAFTIEAVMKWFAYELGYDDEAEYWGIVGLLHDININIHINRIDIICIHINIKKK